MGKIGDVKRKGQWTQRQSNKNYLSEELRKKKNAPPRNLWENTKLIHIYFRDPEVKEKQWGRIKTFDEIMA